MHYQDISHYEYYIHGYITFTGVGISVNVIDMIWALFYFSAKSEHALYEMKLKGTTGSEN